MSVDPPLGIQFMRKSFLEPQSEIDVVIIRIHFTKEFVIKDVQPTGYLLKVVLYLGVCLDGRLGILFADVYVVEPVS